VRYRGFYADAARGKRREAAPGRDGAQVLAFILDFGSTRAIRKSLKLPAQDPEPLAHAPPETPELVAESASSRGLWRSPAPAGPCGPKAA
jgi:hypothetical protein